MNSIPDQLEIPGQAESPVRVARSRRAAPRTAFTLIELLVALAIFSLIAAMSAGVFWSISKAWTRGGEMLEQLQHGEFAMEQLVTAMRGAAWFSSKPEAFGFWLDSRGGTSRSAANKISWVTSGTAFLPPDSPFQHGLHRLSVTIEGSGNNRGLVVRAWPHLTEDVSEHEVDSWLVAPGVEGLSCEWYDFDTKRWTQDWEETNSLPKLVRLTMTMQPRKEFDEYLEIQRLVELEVAPDIPGRDRRARTTVTRTGGTTPADPAQAGGAGAEDARARMRAAQEAAAGQERERGTRIGAGTTARTNNPRLGR